MKLENLYKLKNHLIRDAIKLVERNQSQNFSVFLTSSLSKLSIEDYQIEAIENLDTYAISVFMVRLYARAEKTKRQTLSPNFLRDLIEKEYNQTLTLANQKVYIQTQFNFLKK